MIALRASARQVLLAGEEDNSVTNERGDG